MKVQEYLRGGKSLEDLQNDYAIKHNFHSKYPELVCLKYSQIDSPMGEKIVQECRGLILNRYDNWNVVSRPYDKFFNYGEGHADTIDWDSAVVYDKLDGSLMTLYWYKDDWHVQSSGTADAGGSVYNYDGKEITFKGLFWKTFRQLGYILPWRTYNHLCFMFELMTPLNKIVVQHTEPKLVLHGVRNKNTGRYSSELSSYKELFNYQLCPTFNLSSIEEIVSSAKDINPTSQEGYIIVDKNFNRIKVKSPAYVALSHTRDSMSPRNMLEVVRCNEGSEILTYFPEFQMMYDMQYVNYRKLKQSIQLSVDLCTELVPNYKEIGLRTKHIFYQGVIFKILRNNLTVDEVLKEMPLKKLEDWVNKC